MQVWFCVHCCPMTIGKQEDSADADLVNLWRSECASAQAPNQDKPENSIHISKVLIWSYNKAHSIAGLHTTQRTYFYSIKTESEV